MAGRNKGLVLAGDIGGTKTYLGLFAAAGGGRLNPLRVERFVNSDFQGIEEVVEGFLGGGGTDLRDIGAASFGVACPVEEGRCRLTNIPWLIDAAALKKRFGLKRLGLINDLVATGWGVGLLKME